MYGTTMVMFFLLLLLSCGLLLLVLLLLFDWLGLMQAYQCSNYLTPHLVHPPYWCPPPPTTHTGMGHILLWQVHTFGQITPHTPLNPPNHQNYTPTTAAPSW